jgi:hypothetical protein
VEFLYRAMVSIRLAATLMSSPISSRRQREASDFASLGYGDERAGILGRKVDFCSRLDPRLEPSIRRDDLHWKDIAGTRDHLIHGYDLIDHRVLWDAVHIDVPRLIEAIDELLG